MIPETIAGLSKLRALFPKSFDILGELMRHGVSSVRLYRMDTNKGDSLYSIICQTTRKAIHDVIDDRLGLQLAYYHEKSDTVAFNAGFDRAEVSKRLSRETGLEITSANIYVFLFHHEIGHRNGKRSEIQADDYAKRKFLQWLNNS